MMTARQAASAGWWSRIGSDDESDGDGSRSMGSFCDRTVRVSEVKNYSSPRGVTEKRPTAAMGEEEEVVRRFRRGL